MQIRTSNQHFPITVTKLLVQPDDTVKALQPIFRYTYTSKVTEGNKYGDEEIVDRTFPADFLSETDGTFTRWDLKEGDVLERSGLVNHLIHGRERVANGKVGRKFA
jgi:RNA polymerase II subunit A-like phosphatase